MSGNDEQKEHNDKSDDSMMDVEELMEFLKTLPKFARVTMAVGDKAVPVSRIILFGLYDKEKEEFNMELGNQKTQQLFSICFVEADKK